MTESHCCSLDVIFVDDEPRLLDGLRRQFRSYRTEWAMRFANSGEEALRMLREEPADVVVTDMRMPGMNGVELLNQVRQDSPGTIRFVLSGQTDQSELLDDIGNIHQFLQKPCEIESLEHAIRRTCTLAAMLESPKLREIVSGIHSLPIISESYNKLVRALEDESCDFDAITEIVEQDVGLSVKILQLVNSAFFGIPRKTASIHDAIVMIGTQNLLHLAMSAQIFDTLSQSSMSKDVVTKIWGVSNHLGEYTRHLAIRGGLSTESADGVRFAGVFSHIGRAIIAWTMPFEFEEIIAAARENQTPIRDEEIKTIGVPQEYVGAYALGLWGFSDQIVESVARQCTPSTSMVKNHEHPLLWLHLARAMMKPSEYTDRIGFDMEWAQSIGFSDQDLNDLRSAA